MISAKRQVTETATLPKSKTKQKKTTTENQGLPAFLPSHEMMMMIITTTGSDKNTFRFLSLHQSSNIYGLRLIFSLSYFIENQWGSFWPFKEG